MQPSNIAEKTVLMPNVPIKLNRLEWQAILEGMRTGIKSFERDTKTPAIGLITLHDKIAKAINEKTWAEYNKQRPVVRIVVNKGLCRI